MKKEHFAGWSWFSPCCFIFWSFITKNSKMVRSKTFFQNSSLIYLKVPLSKIYKLSSGASLSDTCCQLTFNFKQMGESVSSHYKIHVIHTKTIASDDYHVDCILNSFFVVFSQRVAPCEHRPCFIAIRILFSHKRFDKSILESESHRNPSRKIQIQPINSQTNCSENYPYFIQ